MIFTYFFHKHYEFSLFSMKTGKIRNYIFHYAIFIWKCKVYDVMTTLGSLYCRRWDEFQKSDESKWIFSICSLREFILSFSVANIWQKADTAQPGLHSVSKKTHTHTETLNLCQTECWMHKAQTLTVVSKVLEHITLTLTYILPSLW